MVIGSWFSQDTCSTVLVFAVAQSQSFSTQHQKSSAGPDVHTRDVSVQEVHPIVGRDLGVMVHKGAGLS